MSSSESRAFDNASGEQFAQFQAWRGNLAKAPPGMNRHLTLVVITAVGHADANVRSSKMAIKDVSVVLAHGAWADGSSWARVITALKTEAVKVLAAPLPLTSLAEDVVALNRSLDRTKGPIVLAGHAYAGAVIALARPERVKALVYVTALAPDEGEKVADVFYRLEPHPQAPELGPDSNGFIWLPEGAFETAFAPNASADDRAVLAAVQRPISLNCITVPVGRPLWKDIPSWFLVAEDDRMIVPATQRYMAERMKAKITAHAVDHTPSVTAPTAVVDVIRDAIRSITGS
jgi:pimeloyl-ACP methyl ester carboxylesterase